MAAKASTLAAEIEAFSLRRGLTELSNCQEIVTTRREQVLYLANQARAAQEEESLEMLASDLQQRFSDEVRGIHRDSRRLIRKLERDADEQRRKLLESIEAAKKREIAASEAIAESKAVLARPIPEFDAAGVLSEAVLRKRIEGMEATKQNLEAKKQAWRDIEAELERLRASANGKTPTRRDVPAFKMSLKDIAGKPAKKQ